MSQATVAEFTAHGVVESHQSGEPFTGRFRLDRSSLTVRLDESTIRVDLSSIFDVQLGDPPLAVNDVFTGLTATIAYTHGFGHEVLFVGGTDDTMERFGHLLFKVLLNKTEAMARHPVSVDGHRTGTTPERGSIRIGTGSVEVRDIEMPVEISLDGVIDFTKTQRTLMGEERDIIVIEHIQNQARIVTELSITSPRRLYLLGRYLRLEYSKVRRELAAIDLSESGVDLLERIVEQGGEAPVKSLLGPHSDRSLELLNRLVDLGILAEATGSVHLTAKGWVLTTQFDNRHRTTRRDRVAP